MPYATTRTPPSRVVVVSHVLPILLEKSEGCWIASWDEEVARPEIAITRYMAIGVRRLQVPCLFVGSLHTFVPRSERAAVNAAIEAAGLNCVCVYHEPSVESRFYQGFCKVELVRSATCMCTSSIASFGRNPASTCAGDALAHHAQCDRRLQSNHFGYGQL